MSKKSRTNKKRLARENRELLGMIQIFRNVIKRKDERMNALEKVIKMQEETIEEQLCRMRAMEEGQVETVRLVRLYSKEIPEEYQKNGMCRQLADYLKQYVTFTVPEEKDLTGYNPMGIEPVPVKHIIAEIKVVKP